MSNVSRSVYQKLKEENKRLLADIEALADPMPDMEIVTPILKRWRKHFRERNEFNKLIQEVAREYIKEHPEYDITSPHFKKP
jgi:hypothetical protein